MNSQFGATQFFATATGWFAVLALVLGSIGINAVVAAVQRRRANEIGLRLALGAVPRQAVSLVIGSAIRMIAVGLVFAALLGYPLLRLLERELFGFDAGTYWSLFGITALLLAVTGLLAAGWPAWRAAGITPLEALRHE